MKTQGMIVKVKSNSCIVLTPEGDYREVPLLEGSRARVGQKLKFHKGRPFLILGF